ncbi:hypothetical protein PRZ48_000595 [Zasmidium cellare]|uniref:NmrA-like domain-containing protein n=1 Tax=Zasmidium cellare TaxID=395010 RepID=A0ABR0EYX7_ZASCE|nr:hypothetical protein PRZ48_000595 [Zasmidium cellare]
MASKKLFVIIGITGNQGGSVAKTFLSDPGLKDRYRLRGISRNPSSDASKHLAAQGVEIVQADLLDPPSLCKAFEGAGVIFSVTDFWALYFDPDNQAKARERGKPIGQVAYELEYEQGRNVADAAARVPELERFVVSMLSSPKKWSDGRYQQLWHYESKADMISYVNEQYPGLAAKMSGLNMGVFFYSWKIVNLIGPRKNADGVHVLTLPCKGENPCPLVDPRNDTGPFVRALLQVEPGVQLYGETSLRSWKEWLKLWGETLDRPVRYEQVSIEWYEKELQAQGYPEGFGTEIAEMDKYGYDGGDPACKRKEDLGIPIPGLSDVKEYIRSEDWSPLR